MQSLRLYSLTLSSLSPQFFPTSSIHAQICRRDDAWEQGDVFIGGLVVQLSQKPSTYVYSNHEKYALRRQTTDS